MKTILLETSVQAGALHWALHAVVADKLIGIVNDGELIHAVFAEDTPLDTLQAAREVIEQHDPVLISTDTTVIAADGEQVARIDVHAPKQDAAPVILLLNDLEVPVELAEGCGTVEFASADPQTIQVRVKDGANRSTSVLTVRAV
jgi:hypothetical protein